MHVHPRSGLKKLSILITNPALREEMGLTGRKTVLKDYTIQACAPKLVRILKTV